MSIPIQSQRENCKIVACVLSHYYLNRRQKIVLVSIDNFPFAQNDLGPSPCTNSGFYRKSQLFSLMDVCYFSNFSLGLPSHFKHALMSSSAFLDPSRESRNILGILTTQCPLP